MSDLADTLSWQLQDAKIPHRRGALSLKNGVKPNKHCGRCGSLFYAAPSHVAKGQGKFCSKSCASIGEGNGRYKESDVACKRCGTWFHVKQSARINGGGRVYCSVECKQASLNAKIICAVCGKSFLVPKSHAAKIKCCSRECSKKSFKNSKPNRVCVTCEKPFYIKDGDLKRGRNIGTFCSTGCMTRNRAKVRLDDGKFASYLEKNLYILLKSERLLEGATREFRFHPTRKWRFDFAWPEIKVAVEVHGGIWMTGRSAHASGAGRERDAEKLNEAVAHGWVLLEVTPEHIKNGRAVEWIRAVLLRYGYRS